MKLKIALVFAAVDLLTVLTAEKPGKCYNDVVTKGSNCITDYDCSGWKKCCQNICSTPECPDRAQPCPLDPCELATCDVVPQAYCVQNPCSCDITWYTADGDVTSLCGSDATDIQNVAGEIWKSAYLTVYANSRSKRSRMTGAWQSLKALRRAAKALRKKQRQISKAAKQKRKSATSEEHQLEGSEGSDVNQSTNSKMVTEKPATGMEKDEVMGGKKQKHKKNKKKRRQDKAKKREAKLKRRQERERKRKEKKSRLQKSNV